jgi:hypothetical protein
MALGCSHSLASVKSATINMGTQGSCIVTHILWICLTMLWWTQKFTFSILRSLHADFHSGYTYSHSVLYSHFAGLLNKVSKYFLEDICLYSHQTNWSIVFFLLFCHYPVFTMGVILASYN